MTQKQAVYPGSLIDDDVMNRAATSHPGVYEGFTPIVSGVGHGAGWQVSLNPGDRGISIWRTTGLAAKGHVTIEETLPVYLNIESPDIAYPRIDVIVGIHRWVAPDLSPSTGLPSGVLLPSQQASYTVIKGMPAAIPEIPTLPVPTAAGDTAVPLFRVNVSRDADNTCLVEPWDPCDWTYGRRAIHHVLKFQVQNAPTGIAATGTITSDATAPVGTVAVAASGTLTSTGVTPTTGDTVTIDGKVYTLKTALTPTEGEVLIGASAATALANLKSAVNHTGVPGTDYSCAAAHPTVTAGAITATTLVVTALTAGTAGNSITTTKIAVTLSWGAATLTGGVAAADTVTIGTKVYTFRNTLTPVEGEVLIGASAATALTNLKSAINHTGVPGTDYSCVAAHPTVSGGTITATTLVVTALSVGTAGNAIATTETSAHLSWGATNLTGGADPSGSTYTFGVVDTTSDALGFDYTNLNIVANRTGEYLVQFTAKTAADVAQLNKKSIGEGVYTVIADRIGRITEILSLKQGDAIVLSGNSGVGYTTGQIQFLGWSDRKFVLEDPANSFTITNTDVTELGITTFPYTFTLPITTVGATAPIAWQILSGTDLPSAIISGSNVVSIMPNYGSWTVKLYGKDSIGKTARKVLRVTKLPSAATITNPTYLVLSSADGENWSSTPGDTYGYLATDTGFTKPFTITSTGGLGPYSFTGHMGANLQNPQVNSISGAALVYFLAAPPIYPNAVYVGQQTATLDVTGAFGTFASKAVNIYAPRVHVHDSGTNWRRTAPNRVKVPKSGAANFLLTLYTGTPALSQFLTNHSWAVVGSGTTLPNSPVFAGSPTANHADLTCTGWPASFGTYAIKVTATVAVPGGTGSTGTATEIILVDFVPHGTLGFAWTQGPNYPLISAHVSKFMGWGYSDNLIVWFAGKWWTWLVDSVGLSSYNYTFTLHNSTDGQSWTAVIGSDLVLLNTDRIRIMKVAGAPANKVIIYYNDNKFAITSNMINWTVGSLTSADIRRADTLVYIPDSNIYAGINYASNQRDVYKSSNGLVWNLASSIPASGPLLGDGYTGMGTNGTIAMAVGSKRVAISTDGTLTAWTYSGIPTGTWCPPMWLKTGLWVIIGIGNQYLTSPDGVVWTTRYLPISFSAQPAVSTTGDLMIIVNNNSGLAYLVSADGLAWEQGTLAASPYSFYNSGIANDGANFVLMGETYSQISS